MGINEYQKLSSLLEFLLDELETIRKKYLIVRNGSSYKLKGSLQEHDIKSFVLLTHAAFENYLEALSILTAKISLKLFRTKGVINNVTLSFAAFELEKKKFSDKKWHHDDDRGKDINTMLTSQMVKFSETLNENNHGMKTKHLNNLLRPVGIELPTDTLLEIALEDLCNKRGKYAHRFLQKFTDVESSVEKLEHNEDPIALIQNTLDVERLMRKLHVSAIKSIFSFDDSLARDLLGLHFFQILNRMKDEPEQHNPESSVFSFFPD